MIESALTVRKNPNEEEEVPEKHSEANPYNFASSLCAYNWDHLHCMHSKFRSSKSRVQDILDEDVQYLDIDFEFSYS